MYFTFQFTIPCDHVRTIWRQISKTWNEQKKSSRQKKRTRREFDWFYSNWCSVYQDQPWKNWIAYFRVIFELFPKRRTTQDNQQRTVFWIVLLKMQCSMDGQKCQIGWPLIKKEPILSHVLELHWNGKWAYS